MVYRWLRRLRSPRDLCSGCLADREASIYRILEGEINLGSLLSTEFGFDALMGIFNGINNRNDFFRHNHHFR